MSELLQVENLAETFRELDLWVEACENLAEHTYRGLAASAFKYVVLGTPEWSGNLAASWRLTVGGPASGYSPSPFKSAGEELGGLLINKEPFSKLSPNPAAINYSYSVAGQELPFVRLGADVFITNTAPYAAEVEANAKAGNGRAFLRPINLPAEMTFAAADKFNDLGDLSEVMAFALAKEKIQ